MNLLKTKEVGMNSQIYFLVSNPIKLKVSVDIGAVDNPVGTGFSYVNTDSYVHELSEVEFPPTYFRPSVDLVQTDGCSILNIFGQVD